MHFHWDNFDSIVSRAFRSLAPPIINLLLVGYIFYDGLVQLVYFVARKLPALSDRLGEVTAQDWAREVSSTFFSLFNGIAPSEESRGTIDSVGSLWELVDWILTSASAVLLSLVFVILLSAYLLDFLVRAIGLALPLRAKIDERRLVYRPKLDSVFKEAQVRFKQEDASRYYLWLRARACAERQDLSGMYFDVRNGLMKSTVLNERAFDYVVAYLMLSIFSMFFDQGTGLGLALLVTLIGCGILARHVRLATLTIQNDIESFVAMPMDLRQLETTAMALPTRSPSESGGSTLWDSLDVLSDWLKVLLSQFVRPLLAFVRDPLAEKGDRNAQQSS